MTFIVATNVVASQPHKSRLIGIGTPTTPANFSFLVSLEVAQIYLPGGDICYLFLAICDILSVTWYLIIFI